MRADIKSKLYSRVAKIAIVTIAAVVVLTKPARAMPPGPHHSFLAGPWELVVKMGFEGPGLRFPVTVSDENKPEKINRVLPILGTPINIKLEQYLPDLKWETTAIKHPGGGIVAKLTAKLKDSEQVFWLDSGNPARQSISSSIGSVAIKRLHDPNTVEKLLRQLTHPKAVGIVSVWPEDSNSPLEYAANLGETITIPKSKYKVSTLKYIPHYSIDTKTKKVTSRSDKPVNPAIKVRIDDGENTYECWLWSKFTSFPHKKMKLPLRIKFTDFDLGKMEGKYILVVTSKAQTWLLFSKKGKTQVQKAKLGWPYPFANEGYFFSIEKITNNAVIKTNWKNNSEDLLHPAIIATIEHNGTVQQVVLEFNKPYHYKSKLGTMVLLYRRRPGLSKGPV